MYRKSFLFVAAATAVALTLGLLGCSGAGGTFSLNVSENGKIVEIKAENSASGKQSTTVEVEAGMRFVIESSIENGEILVDVTDSEGNVLHGGRALHDATNENMISFSGTCSIEAEAQGATGTIKMTFAGEGEDLNDNGKTSTLSYADGLGVPWVAFGAADTGAMEHSGVQLAIDAETTIGGLKLDMPSYYAAEGITRASFSENGQLLDIRKSAVTEDEDITGHRSAYPEYWTITRDARTTGDGIEEPSVTVQCYGYEYNGAWHLLEWRTEGGYYAAEFVSDNDDELTEDDIWTLVDAID